MGLQNTNKNWDLQHEEYYIGVMKRNLQDRFQEHQKDIEQANLSAALL